MSKKSNSIESLLETHGKRVQPDDLMKQRALQNVKSHWQQKVQQRKFNNKKRFLQIAAAITLMVSTAFLLQIQNFNNEPIQLFSSLIAKGEVLTSDDGEHWTSFDSKLINEPIYLKTTAESRLSLNLLDSSQLRINSNTIVRMEQPTSVELIQGEIYHDADLANSKQALKINTKFGQIQHIGTRYMVKLDQNSLDISVRNGLVKLENNQQIKKLKAGQKVITKANGQQQMIPIKAYDEMWNWTQLATDNFNSQNKKLYDFIIWYAHENGYEIHWNNKKQQTRNVSLSGKLDQLDSTTMIKTVFLSTKFDYQINQGILSIL